MNYDIQKMVTRYTERTLTESTGTARHYEFTVYRRRINYYIQPFNTQYGTLQGSVEIDAYGLIVREVTTFLREERFEEWDKGLLSARMYLMDELVYFLCKLKSPDIGKINDGIAKKLRRWDGKGSTFTRVAQKKLVDRYSDELDKLAKFIDYLDIKTTTDVKGPTGTKLTDR